MLDQNTDRMWYVIGAVLIGASIIFGMNTFMPNAFASVGGMFEDTISMIEAEQQLADLEDTFAKGYWEDGGLYASNGQELNGEHWSRARIRHKEHYLIDMVNSFEISFNHEQYRLYAAYYDENYVQVGRTGWRDSNTIENVPMDAKYIRFTAGPFDRNGSGNDRGIGMDEFDILNVRFKIIDGVKDGE